ncbi:murein hydrolase activator EnvC family protein [Halomonas daqiaonensis]|uniref:Septal ring factor EnvC, activator of murein hydrolases AmiA and AmiB n=1 Tax=Halomonas daqiaonensis TaxID=650850 RepID=A0A1H7NLG2_9GAMM|nr:peptidoglycan DD-metalloendopeptidase family protein [Halomonas daqiaonensis]SEL23737.1 Septal ring factor EnvC, activator of murein hydrolases AmiA and AmiB [Halomonas daqiaonensis]
MTRGVATLGTWRPGPTLLLGLTLVMGLAAPPLAAQPSEREAQQRLDALGEALREVSEQLSTTREARDEASEALREVETALAETHRQLDALQAERLALDDEIATLETRREQLAAERTAQIEALKAQLDALYRLGRAPQLKLLLNQDDPARLDRLQHYLNRLARARNERLDELARLDTELAENRRALEQRVERLESVAAELAARSATLAEQMAERTALMARLDERFASEQARLAKLAQDRAHAERILREVQEQLARLDRPPPSTAIEQTRGELPWPVQGSIASSFQEGAGVHRNGLLIQAAAGTPVEAVHAGRVVFADWMRGFGNLLIVDHGDQMMTLHAHLQHFTAGVGTAVSRGDPLGTVGDSGGQQRPGLYFEVRRGGDPIDPRRWIARQP